jgi:hypothetical protein
MWKNIVQLDKTQMTIWYMLTECRITKATDEHSEYVIIIAFTLQQFLHECGSMLRDTFIVCLYLLSLSVLLLYFNISVSIPI